MSEAYADSVLLGLVVRLRWVNSCFGIDNGYGWPTTLAMSSKDDLGELSDPM